MGRERKIVIATLVVGCTLGLLLWVMGSGGAKATPMRLESEAGSPPVGAEATEDLGNRRRIPIATSPFDPEPEAAARPALTFVTGRVWNVDRAPAIGARVGMGRSTLEDGEEMVAAWTEIWADTDGCFRFRATPGWRVRLWADSSSSIATLLPPFEIAPGENRVDDIFLVPGATVSGRVRDDSGAPVPDVVIEASTSWPSEEVVPELTPHRLLPKSLQPLSKRHIWAKKDGTYLLLCVHPYSRLRVSAHHATLVARQGTLEVEAGATAVDFDLERLRDGLIKGRIARIAQGDLTRIRVQLRGDRGNSDWTEAASLDSAGCFEIRIRGGFAGMLRAVDRLGRYRPSRPRRVVATPGEVVEDVVLALEDREGAPSPRVGVTVR